MNVALQPVLDWDGRAATLEEQLRGVFSVEGDMGMDLGDVVARLRTSRRYDEAFDRVYGRRADVEAVVRSVTAFQRSLVVAQSRFDRFYLGGDSTALSASEIRGWRLFRTEKAGCAGCHVPVPYGLSGVILFNDNDSHNLGVGYASGRFEDIGRFGVTRRRSDWGRFKTPSLRNVALTSPYMHDGSLATLEEVVDFYTTGGNRNPWIDVVMGQRTLTDKDRADLVAFLRSLTTEWLTDSNAVRESLLVAGRQTALLGLP